jgi:hypothetical protein
VYAKELQFMFNMNENFIELLIWIIAYEISKDHGSKNVHCNNVFRKICNLMSEEYNIKFNNNDPLNESRIELGKKMINYYQSHFTVVSDNDSYGDGAMKFIKFPLMNGKYDNEFKQLNMIGNGSFGNVYRAVNILDRQEYAIKKVPLYGNEYD